MTWIMFDELLIHPESGNYFVIEASGLKHKILYIVDEETTVRHAYTREEFESLEQAQQRFEELKQLLLEKTFKEILNR